MSKDGKVLAYTSPVFIVRLLFLLAGGTRHPVEEVHVRGRLFAQEVCLVVDAEVGAVSTRGEAELVMLVGALSLKRQSRIPAPVPFHHTKTF